MLSVNSNEAKNSISVVSRRTGLTQHVIRVWERRYSAVVPFRTKTNRRLYSEDDISRLLLLQEAIKLGHSIGNIAQLPEEALQELLRQGRKPVAHARRNGVEEFATEPCAPETCLETCKVAVAQMDGAGLDAALMRAHRGLSLPDLISAVVTPLLVWVGVCWKDGSLRIAHEHFVSNGVRHFLANVRNAYGNNDVAPAMVFTTLQGSLHELGALMASIVAAAEGWNDLYLGPNLPIEEIANTVELSQARALGLSMIYPHHRPNLEVELSTLVRHIRPEVPIVIGGQATRTHRPLLESLGIHVVEDIQSFRIFLMQVEQGRIVARQPMA